MDPATGIYTFNDVNRDGVYNLADRIVFMNADPKFYGGWVNTFNFKNLELECLFEFRKQQGLNYLFTQAQYMPGYFYYNQPDIVLNRWQKPGDVTNIQRFGATGGSAAFIPASEYLSNSEAIYSDASFIRLKNISLSYRLPESFVKKLRLLNVLTYIRGQNLFTITNYIGADPESQNLYVLPPLKTIVAGIQFNF